MSGTVDWGDPKTDDQRYRRGIAYLRDEDILRALQRAGQGYTLRGVFADPATERVAILVTHPDLPVVAPGRQPYELDAAVEFEHRVFDGEVWSRPKIVVAERADGA